MRMSSPIVSVEANWHTTFDSAIQSFDHRQKSLCLHNWSSHLRRLICLSQRYNLRFVLFISKIIPYFVDAVISLLVYLFLSQNYESYNDINNNNNNNNIIIIIIIIIILKIPNTSSGCAKKVRVKV